MIGESNGNGTKMRKSVSFAGLSSMREWKIANVKDCVRYMQQGSEFIKLRRKNHHFTRFFALSPSNDEIRWSPSSKKGHKASLRIVNIREVRSGMNTDLFRSHELAKRHSENCAFSIMHGPDFASLDVISKSPETASIWVAGLTALINEAKNQKEAKGVLSPPDSVSTSSDSNDLSGCTSYALSTTAMTAAIIVPIPIEGDPNDFDVSRANRKDADPRDRWLRELFLNADLTHEGMLSHSDAIRLMKNLGNGLGTVRIKQKLEDLGVVRNGVNGRSLHSNSHGHAGMTMDQFMDVIKDLFTRPDIYFLLIRYSSDAEHLTVAELINFMESEQTVRLTAEEAAGVIAKYEPSLSARARLLMTVDGLISFLTDPVGNNVFDSAQTSVTQDMTQPLSHYFINASHKTYLMEDQLTGPSSVEGYINAFKAGARYVEIDVFDGALPHDNPQPVVFHGNTLTTKIALAAVLDTIGKHAFDYSDYPLIVSLQNHCSLKQQCKVLQLVTAHLGSQLYPPSGHVADTIKQLPSPEQLRRRIIIKITSLRKNAESTQQNGKAHGAPNGVEDSDGKKIVSKKLKDGTPVEYGYVTDEGDSEDESLSKRSSSTASHHHHQPKKDRKRRLLKQLCELGFLNSSRFKSLDQIQNVQDVYAVSERSALKLATSKADEFVTVTKRNLFRVYPNSSRIDSSNMNAQDFWNCGCQLVTMNFQSPGSHMDVYHGFFRKNGACGYVLKPPAMRDPIAHFNARLTVSAPDVPTQFISIKVLSAQNVPTTQQMAGEDGVGSSSLAVHPLIACQMFGVPIDRNEQSGRVLDQPVESFNVLVYETFHFLVSMPQLATVRFLLVNAHGKSESERFLAQASIPVDCLRNGYRVVRLTNVDWIPVATLFVHVSVANHCNAISVRQRSSTVSRSASSLRDADAGRGRYRSHSQIGRRATFNSSPSFSSGGGPHAHYYDRRGSARDGIAIKQVGVKQVDELFKQAGHDMERAVALREAVSVSLATLKQQCGLDMKVSARHCVRYLLANVAAASPGSGARRRSVVLGTGAAGAAPYRVVMNGNQVEVTNPNSVNNRDVQIPSAFENIVATVNRLLRDCQSVTEQAGVIVEKLSTVYDRAVDLYAELPAMCEAANAKGKRLHSAMDHFAWNVRAIKGQSELLRSTKDEAAEIQQQVRTTVQNYATADSLPSSSVSNSSSLTSVTFHI